MSSTEHPHQELAAGTGQSGPPEPPADHPGESLLGGLAEMVRELIQYRELLGQMVLRDVRIRYKQAIMGFGWAVFMPLMIVGAGFLVKYAMARMSGTDLHAAAFSGMTVKALGWAFFVGAIGFSANSLTGNISLVTKIYFPREVFPLSAVLTQAVDSLIGSAFLAVFLLTVLGVGFSTQQLWLIPLLAALLMLTTAAALALSCANVFFRDVKYLVQIVVSFGIFFTPVFYEPESFGPLGCRLMMLNPLAPLLEGMRLAAVGHIDQFNQITHVNLLNTLTVGAGGEILAWTPWYLVYSLAWAVLGLLVSWRVFHKLEFVYAEYI